MIPDSAATVVAFLLLIAPGAVWELLRARHLPTVKETTLIEMCRVVLVSLAATTAAGVSLFWMWVPGYAAILAEPTPGADNRVLLFGMVAATASLACGYVLLLAFKCWPDAPSIVGARVWHRAFVEWRTLPDADGHPGEPSSPVLTVELLDGTIWKGAYGAVDSDPEDSHRNLALQHPLSRKRPTDNEFERKNVGAVLLPEREIRSIQVTYPRKAGDLSATAESRPGAS